MTDDTLLSARHFTLASLIKTYWQSEKRGKVIFVTLVIFLMTMVLVGFDVVFNYWYNYFYNALQAYHVHDTIKLLGIFCVLAAVYIIISVYRFYISQLFELHWRRWLSEKIMHRWLFKKGYYYLENFGNKTDNPDQRIQEDVMGLVSNGLELAVGVVKSITTIFAFIFILWQLSGIIKISLGHGAILQVHGYLVWVSILYTSIGTWLTFKIGRPLVKLNYEQQRREASFRFAAIDVRTHAEPIALYRGEAHQQNLLHRFLGEVLDIWYAVILREKLLLWFTGGFGQIAILLPLVASLPNYFGKVFLLGGLMQSLSAFGSVQDSLSFLVNSFTQIADWRATGQRLTNFMNHLDEVEEAATAHDKVTTQQEDNNKIHINNVTVYAPDGALLLKNIQETFIHGKNYLIQGPSGLGKSTFLRTLAGIWPYAAGDITLPKSERLLFLPQKPYMPLGTLSEAILFPDSPSSKSHEELSEVLKACCLEKFIPRLKEVSPWSQILSPGEQQRIAFTRVLLQKPDWVFLDESTSMLDLKNETHLYTMIKEILPHCSIVSVGHRSTLAALHDEVIHMEKYQQN